MFSQSRLILLPVVLLSFRPVLLYSNGLFLTSPFLTVRLARKSISVDENWALLNKSDHRHHLIYAVEVTQALVI
jgi:hypothetical protein